MTTDRFSEATPHSLKVRYKNRQMNVWLRHGRRLRLLLVEAAEVAHAIKSPGGDEVECPSSGSAIAVLQRAGGQVGLRVLFAPGERGSSNAPLPRVGESADFIAWMSKTDAVRMATALEMLSGLAPIAVDAELRGDAALNEMPV